MGPGKRTPLSGTKFSRPAELTAVETGSNQIESKINKIETKKTIQKKSMKQGVGSLIKSTR